MLIVLVVFIVAREVYFYYTVDKLINKLMSRNYLDYTMSSTAADRSTVHKKPNIKVDDSADEDLGILSGIG